LDPSASRMGPRSLCVLLGQVYGTGSTGMLARRLHDRRSLSLDLSRVLRRLQAEVWLAHGRPRQGLRVTMGKPTGFLEYPRELPLAQAPAERVRHWREFHEHADERKLQTQGARCMDCGLPFCHTGTLLDGMASGCPINNLIPEWNDLVY